LALLTAAALVLRLLDLGKVAPDPFYDAAVRSMGLSWHNFFFGAFEPGGSVSIDKPPVDLWLQVASVKALGFSSATLKLQQAHALAAGGRRCARPCLRRQAPGVAHRAARPRAAGLPRPARDAPQALDSVRRSSCRVRGGGALVADGDACVSGRRAAVC